MRPAARGLGVGRKLLEHLARIAVERGWGRFEWSVLDWNEPSIAFYKKMGAKPMDEWTVFRVTGEALQKLADRQISRSMLDSIYDQTSHSIHPPPDNHVTVIEHDRLSRRDRR